MPFLDMSLLEQLLLACVLMLVILFWASVFVDVWAWLRRKRPPTNDRFM